MEDNTSSAADPSTSFAVAAEPDTLDIPNPVPKIQDSEDVSDYSESSSEPQAQAGAAMSTDRHDDIVKQLSEGFLACHLPDAEDARSKINELTHSQNVLIEAIQHENDKFNECKEFEQLGEIMSEARHYHTKLLNLKKRMSSMTERSTKLKRQALELQQRKQKKLLQLEQEREREMERERQLTAKPAQKPAAS